MVENHGSPSPRTNGERNQDPSTSSQDRTVRNDSTAIDLNRLFNFAPESPRSVIFCDIFRPLRETFFCDEKEKMLSLRRSNPICCSSLIDTLSDDEDDKGEEHKSTGLEVPYFPIEREDAFATQTVTLPQPEETIARRQEDPHEETITRRQEEPHVGINALHIEE